MASRNPQDGDEPVVVGPEGPAEPISPGPVDHVRPEEGLTVYLKVNYKVVLLVFVLLDLLHLSVNELIGDYVSELGP